MLSGQQIAAFQSEAASRARKRGAQPFVLFSEETAKDDIRRAANLGDYVPPGWVPARFTDYIEATPKSKLAVAHSLCAFGFEDELVFSVDKGGWGDGSEPAVVLTELEELACSFVRIAAERDRTIAFGICEEGQFQLFLRGFER